MFLCFVCFWREQTVTVFALKRTSLGSVLDCAAPCFEESLLSSAELRCFDIVDMVPKFRSENCVRCFQV